MVFCVLVGCYLSAGVKGGWCIVVKFSSFIFDEFEKSQRSVTYDFLHYTNILLLTCLVINTVEARCKALSLLLLNFSRKSAVEIILKIGLYLPTF